MTEYELFSIKEGIVYLPENATLKKVGKFWFLTDRHNTDSTIDLP